MKKKMRLLILLVMLLICLMPAAVTAKEEYEDFQKITETEKSSETMRPADPGKDTLKAIVEALVKRVNNIDKNHPYKGKTVAFYGDSLTEKGFGCKKGYHEWITELAKLKGYENYAVQGFALKDIYHQLIENKTEADIIFIMGGTNDQTWSIPYGVFTDQTEETTCGSLYLICEYLKNTYPDRKIIFITPPYQKRYPHKKGILYDQIGDAVKHYADDYNFLVYDNGSLSGINEKTVDKMTFDGCHWTDQTHEKVGRAIAKWLNSQ